jgi:hypothetical protein
VKPSLSFHLLTVGFLAVALSAPAAAATYYVNKNNTQCSDTVGSGTQARPFCSVRYTTTMANPGDIFLISPGRYGEGGTFTRSGTAAAPITYRAVGSTVSIGSFNDVRDEDFETTQYTNVYSIPWTRTCCSEYRVTQTYFAPIVVDDPNPTFYTMRQEDGPLTLHPVYDFTTLTNIEGTWMFSGGRIYVHTYGHRRPSTTTTDLVIGHVLDGRLEVAASTQYNVFDGLTLNHSGGTGTPSFTVLGSNNRFLNLRFQSMPWALRGSNNYAENISACHVGNRGETWEWHNSGNGTSIGIRGSNHTLKNIHVFHSWNAQITPEGSTGVTVDGLRAHGSPNHCGFFMEMTNFTLRNFIAYNCQDVFWIESSQNTVLEHVTVPGGIYILAEESPSGRVTVRNSIWGGSWTFDPVRSASINCDWERNTLVENNVISANATIKHCTDNQVYPIQEYMTRCQNGQLTNCMTLRNNIFVTDFTTVIQGGLWIHSSQGVVWEPRLVANSPAINAGTISGAPYDINGLARPQGSAYDIGAYEACASSGCSLPAASACDLNQDTVTNIQDVQLSINQALNVSSCTADLNDDGLCNILDVQRVGNAVLTGTCNAS